MKKQTFPLHTVSMFQKLIEAQIAHDNLAIVWRKRHLIMRLRLASVICTNAARYEKYLRLAQQYIRYKELEDAYAAIRAAGKEPTAIKETPLDNVSLTVIDNEGKTVVSCFLRDDVFEMVESKA